MLPFLSGLQRLFCFHGPRRPQGSQTDFSADKVLARSILFSLDRAFNEFPVISFYTPAAFIDFGVFRYVPFGPYLLDFFVFYFFPMGLCLSLESSPLGSIYKLFRDFFDVQINYAIGLYLLLS